MHTRLIAIKPLAVLLIILLANLNIAAASDRIGKQAAKTTPSEIDESQHPLKTKGDEAPEGEVYKPEAMSQAELEKYRKNETKVSRPEKIKPTIDKPKIDLPKSLL